MQTQLEDERYILFLRYAILAALSSHVLFTFFFYLLGSNLLAVFNILSVLIYAACIFLLGRRHITAIILLGTLEIIAHACLAVWVLGWNSGFHYYIITLMLLTTFHPQWPIRGKVGYIILVALSYLLLNQWSLEHEPTIEIGVFTLNLLRWSNITLTFGLLGYNAHFYAKVAREAENKLELLASTDTLTGLYNRREMLKVFKQEQSKLRRNQRPLSIIMIDIDNFKKINDQFGHECGDEALKAIAACFKKTLRIQDHVARWGGEEFLIMLPETDLKSAQIIAEKVRVLTSQVPITTDKQVHHVTITSAVGEMLPEEEFDRCLSRIDNGLLAGKRAGKNQVVTV